MPSSITTLVAARLPNEDFDRLNAYAQQSGKRKADLIKQWIFEGFDRLEQEDQPNKKAA